MHDALSTIHMYTVSQKMTLVILNVLYSCKSVAVKFSMQYPEDLCYQMRT